MLGTVYFADGHTEEIRDLNNSRRTLYFRTDSGKYGYTVRIEQTPTGSWIGRHVFLKCYFESGEYEGYLDTIEIDRIEVNEEKEEENA